MPRRAGLTGGAEAGGAWDSPAGAGLWDEVPWKGGNVENGGQKGLQGLDELMRDVRISSDTGEEKGKGKAGSSSKDAEIDQLLQSRHDGLGSINVLAWAVRTIASSFSPSSSSPSSSSASAAHLQLWEEAWPLVVPPLLTLLDDSTIISRVLGARILYYGMLLPPSPTSTSNSQITPEAPGATTAPTTLLIRTGLLPLFSSSLNTSLAFITDPLSHLCLHDTLLTARMLALRTTSQRAAAVSSSLKARGKGAGGTMEKSRMVQRFDKLCGLLDEGILRAWVYIPLPINISSGNGNNAAYSAKLSKLNFDKDVVIPDEEDDDEILEEEDGIDDTHRGQANQELHQGTATMLPLLRIAQVLFKDVGPPGCARYFDQAAEFLCALLERRAGESTGVDAYQDRVQLSLALEAVKTLQVLVDACTEDYFASSQATCISATSTSDSLSSQEQETSQPVRAFPQTLLLPNLIDRASEIIFAVATCWIQLRVEDKSSISAAEGAEEGEQLRTAMKSLVGTLRRALPSLEEEDVKEIKALDARLKGLFET